MKPSEKHIRKVGTIPIKNEKQDQFQIEMKNDSLLLFNKLANIMTILIDHGPSASIAEQRRINDRIAREILGDQYNDFVTSYETTFGRKWFSYKDEDKPKSVKIKPKEDKPKSILDNIANDITDKITDKSTKDAVEEDTKDKVVSDKKMIYLL